MLYNITKERTMDETPKTWMLLFVDIEDLQLTSPRDDYPDLEAMWKGGDSRVGFLTFSAPAGLPMYFINHIGKGHAFDAGRSADICLTQVIPAAVGSNV